MCDLQIRLAQLTHHMKKKIKKYWILSNKLPKELRENDNTKISQI